MVKQSVLVMSGFFTRERFGKPQFLAGLLLLVFLAECGWLIAHENPSVVSPDEFARIEEGMLQWHGKGIAGTPGASQAAMDTVRMRGDAYEPDHSPLWYLVESAPLAVLHTAPDSRAWLWITRAPYVLIGVLLGASVWYVSRRLYGNAGGYIALALYCFSPAVLRGSCLWFTEPDIAGAWGAFGAVFTAIAVSHTLYAPREVVLWNWRRILLLGVSLFVALGSHFGLVIVLPVLLVFMLYVAPERMPAALAILAAALIVCLFLLAAAYFFHLAMLLHGLKDAEWLQVYGHAFAMPGAYLQIGQELAAAGPVLVVLIPAALITYAAWPRCRYFGNTAPLALGLLFVVARVASHHQAESVYTLLAVVFFFVFVAGIAADLLETKAKELGRSVIVGLIGANAIWNLIGLARLAR